MAYPHLKVMGDIDSGLIIEADLPSHLAGKGHPRRSIILTPHQSKELLRQMYEKFKPETVGIHVTQLSAADMDADVVKA